ncbi:unnamed protein product [Cylindrotheca closterium]|uniref:GOLD domain-containing protein n=1 Tax=Cylindrotheca closterium TaxID=2856 RepID=A0AAD2FTZ4_9STRA|nr:unnamed protein product [Cylindrotheca closterium]
MTSGTAMSGQTNGNGKMGDTESEATFANGTLVYWKFENGNFWGSVKDFKNGKYVTSWSDGDVHILKEETVRHMVYHAQATLINIPERFEKKTKVQKYFENDGKWWTGKIIGKDRDHNYKIEWSNGAINEWNALDTVAMVQDAKDFDVDESKEQETEHSDEEKEEEEDEETYANAKAEEVENDESERSADSSSNVPEVESVDESVDEVHQSTDASSYLLNDSTEVSSIATATSIGSEDPGDAILPSTFPRTEEGLKEFLSRVDGSADDDGHNQEATFEEEAIFQANLKIEASSTREIPIPTMVPNSLVQWAIRIDETDISFSIRLKRPSKPDQIEDIVEETVVYAKEEETEQEAAEDSNPLTNSVQVDPSERGEFMVDESSSTIILEFDNSYSWFREKTISYHVRIVPPLPHDVSDRAEKSYPYVMKLLRQAQFEVNFSKQAVAAAEQNVGFTEHHFGQMEVDIERKQRKLRQMKQAASKLDERRVGEEQKLLAHRKRLEDKELYISKLEEAMKELEKERDLCWGEKQQIQNSIYDQERQLMRFDDDCKNVESQAEEVKSDLCDLQIEVLLKDNHVADMEEALEKAKADEAEAIENVAFLERAEEALKLRLGERTVEALKMRFG